MKSIVILAITMGLGLLSRAADDDPSPIDKLGLSVFKAVQSGDKDALASHCLLAKEEILRLSRKSPPGEKQAEAEFKAALRKNVDRIVTKQKETFDRGWSQIQADLKSEGIDMAKADYYGVDARFRPFEGKSYIAGLKVVFRIEGKLHAIRCSDVIRVPGGLKLEDAPRGIEKYSY